MHLGSNEPLTEMSTVRFSTRTEERERGKGERKGREERGLWDKFFIRQWETKHHYYNTDFIARSSEKSSGHLR
jgi:hypothetical protein